MQPTCRRASRTASPTSSRDVPAPRSKCCRRRFVRSLRASDFGQDAVRTSSRRSLTVNSKPEILFPMIPLTQQAAGARQGKRRGKKGRATPASRGGTAASANDLPLVEEERLFV